MMQRTATTAELMCQIDVAQSQNGNISTTNAHFLTKPLSTNTLKVLYLT